MDDDAPPPAAPRHLLDALRRHPVFGRLDDAARADLAGRFKVESAPAGQRLAEAGSLPHRLGWILSGQVRLSQADASSTDGDAGLLLGSDDLFGAGAVPRDDAMDWRADAQAPVEVAWLGVDALREARARHPVLAMFLGNPPATDTPADAAADPDVGLLTRPVRSLLKRAPITLPPDASILATATLMRDERISSVLLVDGDRLAGLVTDRDLRNRVLAGGIDPARPIRDVATPSPWTIGIDQPAFEALLMMARHNIHHVPVLDGARIAGMITTTDLTEQHSSSAVFLASDIRKQTGIDGLVDAAAKVRPLQRSLVASGASAHGTGRIVTAITDALTVRLLELGEAALGPAPLPYAWVAAGSQGRSEQTAKSDQDNCLVLDDRYDPARDGAYFKALAQFVNRGLDACGYVYCPGEMMAQTDAWRQPRSRWLEYFRQWTTEPEPTALMLTTVFFDLRVVHGHAPLLDSLRRTVLNQTRGNRIFLSYLVGNALTHRPPLNLFGGLSTVRAGTVRDAIDLKHSGVVPIIDLARIYALAGGHEAVNTRERLAIAAQGGEISEPSARDLSDALEFLATLRIQHQARQTERGLAADNLLSLSELSNFERSQLKDAFAVVQLLQTVLAQRYR